jgi:hypothetical protein
VTSPEPSLAVITLGDDGEVFTVSGRHPIRSWHGPGKRCGRGFTFTAMALLGDRCWYLPRWLRWLPGRKAEAALGPRPTAEAAPARPPA